MYYWFGDHTDFKSHKNEKKPDVFILGGILISDENLKKAKIIIQNIKRRYTHENMPVKWNMRDLKKKYEEFGLIDEYNQILVESAVWRKELFENLSDLDYIINLACIENFQKHSKDKNLKYDLIRYAFSNALMRVGLEIKELNQECTVIMDWPDRNNSRLYNREYYYAYNFAKSVDGIEYFCGSLDKLNFSDCVLFANMNHSVGLQIADMVVGAYKDGIKSFRDGHSENIGNQISQITLPHLYGFEKQILGYGLSVSNSNHNFKEVISQYIEEISNQAEIR